MRPWRAAIFAVFLACAARAQTITPAPVANLLQVSVLAFGADPTNTSDNSAAFGTAFTTTCGAAIQTTLTVPPGHYKFSHPVTDPKCGVTLVMDPSAVLDFSGVANPTTPQVMMPFSGTVGIGTGSPTPIQLHTDATVGSASVTVSSLGTAFPTGPCPALNAMPVTQLPNPQCAALVWSTAVWDYVLSNHEIGEIRLIRSITGSGPYTITFLRDTVSKPGGELLDRLEARALAARDAEVVRAHQDAIVEDLNRRMQAARAAAREEAERVKARAEALDRQASGSR